MIDKLPCTAAALVVLAFAVPAARADDFGATVVKSSAGLQVRGVAPRSLAAQMSLEKGDVILTVNGRAVDTPQQLLAAIVNVKDLRVQVKHDGKTRELAGLVYWPQFGENGYGANRDNRV